MLTRGNKPKQPYKCLNCRDRNYLIECVCGCGEIIFLRDKQSRIRRFKKDHNTKKGLNHPMWNGGIKKTVSNYNFIWNPNHPNSNSDNYVYEHVLIMSNFIGRPLKKGEIVHHIDGNRQNNNINNLQLMTNKEHMRLHHLKDMSNRICFKCKSNETYRWKNTNRPLWHYIDKKLYCNTCYCRYKKLERKGLSL